MEEQFTQTLVNVNTGKIEIIDLSDQQIQYALETRKIAEKLIVQEQAEAEAKAQAKATAEGKLAALGLTTDDLRALGL